MNNHHDDDLLLDKFDIAILTALQKDASSTHQQLGDAVFLSPSQVSRRITRLHHNGTIRGSVALAVRAKNGVILPALNFKGKGGRC